MSSFAELCGIHDARRQQALEQTQALIQAGGIELVRFAWCDLHGILRGKTLVAAAAAKAMMDGVGLVSTLLLKDSSDRTAFKVFEAGGTADLPGFEFASNLLLLADPGSFRHLPWTPATAWVQGQPWMQDGSAVELDTRRILQRALARLADAGYGMKCGLEIEFHIYRITGDGADDQLDPEQAAWPGPPPKVAMIHPGYNLLAEQWFDMAEEPLRIVQHTAQALGLPLQSLEIELGPSQVEAVFDATDALTAADNMVLFRSAVKQALRRAGYHATFMCRPPFPDIMSSGWHLHQSLVDIHSGANLFQRDAPAAGTQATDAQHTLSALGEHYLAGLLEHARGMTVFCTPTINGFGRFRPNALAPQSVLWGRDNRGAMLRVVGQPGDGATRIENRIGEPAANPYLYLASQIHAGLDGITRQLKAPVATDAPYGDAAVELPT
ncbi:MAG: glutamine synthetase family protein, partial [Polaromonas sp.]|nr:glutamine synthetase family protein [Polaromonas sp.]